MLRYAYRGEYRWYVQWLGDTLGAIGMVMETVQERMPNSQFVSCLRSGLCLCTAHAPIGIEPAIGAPTETVATDGSSGSCDQV